MFKLLLLLLFIIIMETLQLLQYEMWGELWVL